MALYREEFGEGYLEVRPGVDIGTYGGGKPTYTIWRVDAKEYGGKEEPIMEGWKDLGRAIQALSEAAEAIRSVLGHGGTGLTKHKGHLPDPRVDKKTA